MLKAVVVQGLVALPIAGHLVLFVVATLCMWLVFLFRSGPTAHYRFTVKALLLRLSPYLGAWPLSKLSRWLIQSSPHSQTAFSDLDPSKPSCISASSRVRLPRSVLVILT